MSYENQAQMGAQSTAEIGPIEQEHSRASKAIERLHAVIGALENKIDGVLAAQPPSKEALNKISDGSTCRVHAVLLSNNELLQGAIERLESIKGRVRL